MTRYSFQLYLGGETERSQIAKDNLRYLCDQRLPHGYDLEVIDVTEHPDMAEEQGILATPMVIRTAPEPERRVIGDLSEHHRAASALGLPEPAPEPTKDD